MEDREQNNIAHYLRIRMLNDEFRTTGKFGVVVITSGVEQLGVVVRCEILQAIRSYKDFNQSNDPYHEHDFGALVIAEQTIFWKIDYYDIDKVMGSPDPADDSVTTRVMTVMLGCEY